VGHKPDPEEEARIHAFVNPPKQKAGGSANDEMEREPDLPRTRNQQFQIDFYYERGLLKCNVKTRVTDISHIGRGGPAVTDIAKQVKEGTQKARSLMYRTYVPSVNTHCNRLCQEIAREAISYVESARGVRISRAKLEVIIDPDTDVAYLVGAGSIRTQTPNFNTGPMLKAPCSDGKEERSPEAAGVGEVVVPGPVGFVPQCEGDYCETTAVRNFRKRIALVQRSGEDPALLAADKAVVARLIYPDHECAYRSLLAARLEEMAECNYFAPRWALLEQGASELVPFCRDPEGPAIDPVKLRLAKEKELGRSEDAGELDFFTDKEWENLHQDSQLIKLEGHKSPAPGAHNSAHGRPHLKIVPALITTGDLGRGVNPIDYYRAVKVCEACCHRYEDIDAFREKVHRIVMEDVQRDNDRKNKEDEAEERHKRDQQGRHCVLNAWCGLGIGHAGPCSNRKVSVTTIMRNGSRKGAQGKHNQEKAELFIQDPTTHHHFLSGDGLQGNTGMRRIRAGQRHSNAVSTGGIKAHRGWYGDQKWNDESQQWIKKKKKARKQKAKPLGHEYAEVKSRLYQPQKNFHPTLKFFETLPQKAGIAAVEEDSTNPYGPYTKRELPIRPRSAHFDSRYRGRLNTTYEGIPTAPLGSPRLAAALPDFTVDKCARPLTSLGLHDPRGETQIGTVRRAEYRRAIKSAKHRGKEKRVGQGDLFTMIDGFRDRGEERDYDPEYNEVHPEPSAFRCVSDGEVF